jgi:hypothetical protein
MTLVEAAERYMAAVKALGETAPNSKVTYFEAEIVKGQDGGESLKRWVELNDSGITLSSAVALAKTSGMELSEVLEECRGYFDNRSDAEHDGDGFVPNAEMRLLSRIDEATKFLENLIA